MDISIIRGLAASAVTRAVDTGRSYPPAPVTAAGSGAARLRLAGDAGVSADLGVGQSLAGGAGVAASVGLAAGGHQSGRPARPGFSRWS